MKKLTEAKLRDIHAIVAQNDEEIDFSDIPPILDRSGAEMGKFFRPKSLRIGHGAENKIPKNGNRRRAKNR